MTVKLSKVEGGFQLVIPDELAAQAGLREGSELDVQPTPGGMIARTPDASSPRRYSLAELLAGITPENVHGEWDVGPPVGKERFWEGE